jgi:hypothetical protein
LRNTKRKKRKKRQNKKKKRNLKLPSRLSKNVENS